MTVINTESAHNPSNYLSVSISNSICICTTLVIVLVIIVVVVNDRMPWSDWRQNGRPALGTTRLVISCRRRHAAGCRWLGSGGVSIGNSTIIIISSSSITLTQYHSNYKPEHERTFFKTKNF